MILTKFQSPASSGVRLEPMCRAAIFRSLRLSASSQRAEQDWSSFDDITDIQRPPRSRGESPTSIDSGEGQQYRDRSQSSETYSRGRSRHRKGSTREFDCHRSRDRKSRHRSSERIYHRTSRSDGHRRSCRRDSQDDIGRHRRSPASNQVGDDRNERSGDNYRSSTNLVEITIRLTGSRCS